MFPNHIKYIIRSIRRYAGYSIINVLGLFVGVISCLLIALHVDYELSFDQFHSKKERIFRVNNKLLIDGKNDEYAKSAFPIARTLRSDFIEIEEAASLFSFSGIFNKPVIRYKDKVFIESLFFAVDPSIFNIFDVNLSKSSSQGPLDGLNKVAISKSTAKKYFGNSDPIGEVIQFQEDYLLEVSGVFEDFPQNSVLQIDFMISTETFRSYWIDVGGPDINTLWSASMAQTYVLLNQQSIQTSVVKKLKSIVTNYYPGEQEVLSFTLQPLSEIHLNPIGGEWTPGGSKSSVLALVLIAILILIACCFNFINLSTARFHKHSTEVGIRKILGSSRNQIIAQFLIESLTVTYFAIILSFIVGWLIIPILNSAIDINIAQQRLLQPSFLLSALLAGIILSIAAGLYPSIVFSRFNPVNTSSKTLARKQLMRKGLIVTQFAISTGLMLGIVIVKQQLSYINNKDLGYEKDFVLTIRPRGDIYQKFDVFKNRLLENPSFQSVCICDPVFSGWDSAPLKIEGFEESQYAAFRYVGEDFEKVFGLELVEGKAFDPSIPEAATWSDANSVFVINETAAKEFGWDSDPLGKKIEYNGNSSQFKGKVVGVVKDFHFESLHEPIKPLVMRYKRIGPISIKLSNINVPQSIEHLETIWSSMIPAFPLEKAFVDDKVQEQYKSEVRLEKVIGFFSGIALFISCLGFVGQASFTTRSRLKELSIRKVHGASTSNLVFMLEKEFMFLSLISFLVSLPISLYFIERWLENFSYQTNISEWLVGGLFLSQCLLVVVIVSFHVVRSSRANPADVLRTD